MPVQTSSEYGNGKRGRPPWGHVQSSNPAIYARLPYDSIADFTPIALLYGSPTVLFVPKGAKMAAPPEARLSLTITRGAVNEALSVFAVEYFVHA